MHHSLNVKIKYLSHSFLQVWNEKRYNWPAMCFSFSSLAELDSVFLLPIGRQGRWIWRHFSHFWKSVYWLLQGGISVHYFCGVKGSANRSFIKLYFAGKDPFAEKFTTVNPYTREPLVFLMDPYVRFTELCYSQI